MILDPFSSPQPTSKTGPLLRRFRKSHKPSSDQLRLRMIQETEIALFIGMHSPGNTIRIPTVQAGKGTFDAGYAARFWQGVLGLGIDPRRAKIWHRLQRVASSFRP